MYERAGDLAQSMIEGPPTDTVPEDAGPPWRTIEEIIVAPRYRQGLPPISTGFDTLDQALGGGLRPESVYVIAGRTGMAKSTLAMNLCRKVAIDGQHVLLAKLEESPREATWRMHAAAAQLNINRLLDGVTLSHDEQEAYDDGLVLIRQLPIRVTDERRLVPLERIARQHVEQGGNLIIVDQISMVDVLDAKLGYERMTLASNAFRMLARDLNVPIVVVAQVNREASRKKDRLTCNDLRDSGSLENDASAVVLIDKVRKPDVVRWHGDPLTLELLIGKNRYGRSTMSDDDPLELSWWPWHCRIEDPPQVGPTGGAA